ncbi:MAG: hypothetical protein ACLFNY_06515, partial [Candidatus Aenigmatarchaeota archaeon]
LTFDIWESEYELTRVERRGDCETCVKRRFDFLKSEEDMTTELCGRDALQVTPSDAVELDLDRLLKRFDEAEKMGENMIKIYLEDHTLNVFKDGRMIVKGTEDPKKARSLYSQYIGK